MIYKTITKKGYINDIMDKMLNDKTLTLYSIIELEEHIIFVFKESGTSIFKKLIN